jgi:hypothetical protein
MNAALSLAEIAEVAPRQKLTLRWRGKTEPVPDIAFVDVTEEPAPPAPVERVLAVSPFDEPAPLQICLGHWRDWMHQCDRDLGAKGQSGIVNGSDEHDGYDDNSAAGDAAAARASREIAMATDAMIDSLPRHYKAAIYRSCNITSEWRPSVWRFPNMDFAAVLPEAEQELAEKLSKNIATRAFF